jgi:hypothetical protein
MQSLADLLSPNNDFWDNVIIVFTHVDLVSDHSSRYQAQKVYLKTKVSKALQERYAYQHELPMAWISTQKYTCGFLKGLGDCDCERGNKYHADSRRRLYQQVIQRRHSPFRM